ncbi:hypothetical protein [Opitutus sp. ER46]|uniref:hypothetical protein n=1 Tax=Opitutus sp. ER46 TaxID=2161864 RepID=UPI000D2FA74E|nr:hypothetical protein [Opitutus sp. ER46]PTX91717.1 hypothetical protein DB354_17800 [Opitutus sp. ER46]
MKPGFRLIVLFLVATVAGYAAEDSFSHLLPAESFAAAGLGKLSAAELARLDALVQQYKSGALAAAQRELEAAQARAAEARQAQADAEARAAAAQAQAQAQAAQKAEGEKKPGLIERAKVLLRPGTQIEYTTLESRLATEFLGWRRNTIFTLENGQRWRVTGDTTYVTPPMPAPNVKIVPGALGTFWIVIEGVRQRARVEPVDAK